jgi:hypothetical protein
MNETTVTPFEDPAEMQETKTTSMIEGTGEMNRQLGIHVRER